MNSEYTKRLGFKVKEKKKNYWSCTGLLKCIRIQKVQVSSIAFKICSTKQASKSVSECL